jgi:hypothetical protein
VICSSVVFLIAILTYASTLAPTVTLVDSGELITAARFLGNAHPPGFPLYLLLAHIATLVPIGNVAIRVNFASAFFAAAAAAVLALVVREFVITSNFNGEDRGGKNSTAQNFSLPAVGAGLLIACSRTLWSYATIAEVYTLNILLVLLIFLLMLRWRRRIIEDERFVTAGRRRSIPTITEHDFLLYVAAGLFGLALGVHHVTVGLMLPALAAIVYRTQGFCFFASRRLAYAALISFGALVIVYSYLPLAASAHPIINWGNPNSFQAIWAHITGKQYQSFFTFSPDIIGAQLVDFGNRMLREFGPHWFPLVLLVALCGYLYVFKRNRTAFWFLTAVLFANVAFASLYDIAEDKDAYYLPSFISVVILTGCGLSWLQERFRNSITVGAVACLLLPAIALASNWPFDNRRHDLIAFDYVDNIEQTIAPDSLLLTLDWQVASPMFYIREVEGRRRDIEVVDINLLRRPWYLDYLGNSFPALIARCGTEFNAFRARLQEWISNPAVAGSPDWQRRMHDAYLDLLRSLITREPNPVYVTQDVLFGTEGQEKELTQWVNENYQAFPQGLVFGLSRDRAFHDPGEPQLQTRGLNDHTMSFESDDVVSLKIVPVYKMMLLNRGRYCAYFHQTERAVKAYTEALAFDPNFELAKKELMENVDKLHPDQAR